MSLIPTSIRLSAEEILFYEAEAARKNIPLRTYLRQKLESTDNIIEEISALKRAVQEIVYSRETNNDEIINPSIMLEILLLLRQLSQPQNVQLVQHELKRQGFNIWDGKRD